MDIFSHQVLPESKASTDLCVPTNGVITSPPPPPPPSPRLPPLLLPRPPPEQLSVIKKSGPVVNATVPEGQRW